MAYIRKFKTGSNAIGVQVCYKQGRKVVKTVHIGSANSEKSLEKLLQKAHALIDADNSPLFNLDQFNRPTPK